MRLHMRARLTALLTLLVLLGAAAAAPGLAAARRATTAAIRGLDRQIAGGMRSAGIHSGADVVDLTTGRTLYSLRARTGRLPASVEKLYTSATALARFGPSGTLTTSLSGVGQVESTTYVGTLYLRGGGDPTFGSASFDTNHYGTGSTVQQLVASFLSTTGVTVLDGNVVADQSALDSDRGTPATGNRPSIWVEGELSGVAFNRGWANSNGTVYWDHPALEAGQQLASALSAAGVQVPAATRVLAGPTPAGATPLASVQSPPLATLLALMNTPSDNFFAEMLLKDIGAHFGAGGTTAAGAAVVRSQMASLGLYPRLNDGSGLSYYDSTTPAQVVSLLRRLAHNVAFTGSLAVAGETGTLQNQARGTYAQGRCRGKTGTLASVSNLVGYCTARDGHTLAFAFLMNGVNPTYAHPMQSRLQADMANYRG